ncbi:MAG: BTAD domain-containing putative transcriptional regulator [Chloroflexaceae bacterium]
MSARVEAPHRSDLHPLQVSLLGPPEVRWADQHLSIPRRQARALLYRLGARLQPVPREQVCFLFWPDIPESVAHRHLSHLLTHLRRGLPFPELLLVTEDHVALDASQVWSDVAAFERLCANLTPIHLHSLPALPLEEEEGGGGARSEVLQHAIALYRGPFLAGFSLPESVEFETWAGQERRACEELYLKALAALIEECATRGEYDDAITYARRYLDANDLAENVHRRLIELYAATGNRAAALRQFEHCMTVMERELGVSPLPETRAAYQTALEGRPYRP